MFRWAECRDDIPLLFTKKNGNCSSRVAPTILVHHIMLKCQRLFTYSIPFNTFLQSHPNLQYSTMYSDSLLAYFYSQDNTHVPKHQKQAEE